MIINLTQHVATPEQSAAGVVEPHNKVGVVALLTFEDMPRMENVCERADALAAIAAEELDVAGITATDDREAMIGGALWLMGPLEIALRQRGIWPKFAFSKRDSVETRDATGKVTKTQVFKHLGFFMGCTDEMGG